MPHVARSCHPRPAPHFNEVVPGSAPGKSILTLAPGTSARVELGALIRTQRGTLVVTLNADGPLVAEVDPVLSPAATGSAA